MKLLTKTFTWVVIFSLLAQTVIAAPPQQNRPSLQDIHAQALQDKSWLERHHVAVISGISATSVLAIAGLIRNNIKVTKTANALKQELTQTYNKVASLEASNKATTAKNQFLQEKVTSLDLSKRQLTEENAALKDESAEVKSANRQLAKENAFLKSEDFRAIVLNEKEQVLQENRHLNNKVNGLQKGREVQLAKYQAAEQRRAAAELKAAAVESELSAKVRMLEEELSLTKRFLDGAIRLSPEMEKAVNRYSEMFNNARSAKERTALRKSLEEEVWFKNFAKEDQQLILKTVDETIGNIQHGISRFGNIYLVSARVSQAADRHAAPQALQFLSGLGRKVLTSKNLLAAGIMLGLFAATGVTTANAQTSKEAQRIESNIDLLLNATPEQLQAWEQDPQMYEACVTAAAVQHSLTQMSGEELAEFNKVFKQKKHTQNIPQVQAY